MKSCPDPVRINSSFSGIGADRLEKLPERAMVLHAELDRTAVGVGLNKDDSILTPFKLEEILEAFLILCKLGRWDKLLQGHTVSLLLESRGRNLIAVMHDVRQVQSMNLWYRTGRPKSVLAQEVAWTHRKPIGQGENYQASGVSSATRPARALEAGPANPPNVYWARSAALRRRDGASVQQACAGSIAFCRNQRIVPGCKRLPTRDVRRERLFAGRQMEERRSEQIMSDQQQQNRQAAREKPTKAAVSERLEIKPEDIDPHHDGRASTLME